MSITKAERQELRGVVRNQFKVLRKEIDQKRAELVAQAEQRIFTRYREQDAARERLFFELRDKVQEWNDEIAELLEANKASDPDDARTGLVVWYQALDVPNIRWAGDRRHELHRALVADIDSQVAAAELKLARQEADLLHSLAVGALESAEAKAFLSTIPKVAELVSDARMAELEAQFDDRPSPEID